jgi:hypothetical protein
MAGHVHFYPVFTINLLAAIPYYLGFMIAVYYSIHGFRVNPVGLFLVIGLFGAVTEHDGLYVLGMLDQPGTGIILLLVVMSVYAYAPLIAYYMTDLRWYESPRAGVIVYVRLIVTLFTFWFLFGNIFYHPTMVHI